MNTESRIIADHREFFKAIDRIKVAGFIALETKRDQLFYKALNELNEILSDSIKLIVSDQNKYDKLFNAERVLSSEFNLNYSVIFSQDNPMLFDFELKGSKVENLISSKSIRYGFHSLVSALSSLRKECLKLERIDLARTVNEGIIELLTKITERDFDNYDYIRYEDELRWLIRDMVYQYLGSNEDDRIVYLKNQGFYSWYFSCIYNSTFDIKRFLNILDDEFFMSIKRAIDKNENQVLRSLAVRLIDGILLTNSHVEYNFIERREWGDKNRRRQLDELLYQGFSSMREVYFLNEFEEKVIHFENIWRELSPKITTDQRKEFENLKNHASRSLRENFMFNHLCINIIHVLSYSLYKENYNILNTFLEYNQPIGNISSYANKDILPVKLNEVKDIVIRRYPVENRFYYLWDNHRDNSPYFNRILIILMARCFSFDKKNFAFQSIYFRDDDEKKSFQGFIERLSQIRLDNILTPSVYKVFDAEFINEFKEAINKIKIEIEADLKGIWYDKKVNEDKIREFKEMVRKGILSYPSIMNIYKYYGKISNDENDQIDYQYVGINQLDHKGYFVEGTGIYVDWPGSYSKSILENLELFLVSEISKIADRKECPKYELLEKLDELDLSNKIIISINFRLSFDILRDNTDFESINHHEFIDTDRTGYAGKYKDSPLYEIFTPSRQWESILILDKEDLGRILKSTPNMRWMKKEYIIDNEFFDIHGFSGNNNLIEEIIAEDLPWMRDLTREEKVNKLKDSVSIRYYQKIAFEQPLIPPIIYTF